MANKDKTTISVFLDDADELHSRKRRERKESVAETLNDVLDENENLKERVEELEDRLDNEK